MTHFSYTTLLGDAQKELKLLAEDGHTCPCCGQMAKVYRRKLNSTMARCLIRLSRHVSYVHVPSLSGDNHEVSQLAWWGLVEEERKVREDGGRAGYWRMTTAGSLFVLNASSLPKYASVFDGTCLGLSGPKVSIVDCLGQKFDYRELMEKTNDD